MNQMTKRHPSSPLLDHCPDSLPSWMYIDPRHYDEEMKKIWGRSWIYVARVNDLAPMSVKRISVAGQNLILVRDHIGGITCYHNTCRHRGSELCSAAETRLKSKLISCPYHDWSYDLQGHLVRTPFVMETPDFKKEDHNLFKVHLKTWNGFIYICLADYPPAFEAAPDLGVNSLDNWPMADLLTGHTMIKELECNWKIIWENYNECLHCPGIHPELCDLVPVYTKGIMAANEAMDWTPGKDSGTSLKKDAHSWTLNGQACGPEFPNLTDEERTRGQTFVTLFPTMYAVAHVDYVRVVSLRPLSAERTELTAQWLFAADTLSAPKFDLANVTTFATTVIQQDGAACELNQRGLRSSAFKNGRLMPQEFDVYRFHNWVRRHLSGDSP
jgi:glycine betaine catabolism A